MKDGKVPSLTADEHHALNEIKARIAGMFPVERFILFGSKARGDAREFSDIDLLAVIDSALTGMDKRKISDMVFEVNLNENTQFSILSATSKDFHSEVWSRLPLFRIIALEGVPV